MCYSLWMDPIHLIQTGDIFSVSASALPGDKVSCQPVICITFIISSYLLLLPSPRPPIRHPRSEISDQTRNIYISTISRRCGQVRRAQPGLCCDDAACERGDMVEILSVCQCGVTAMSYHLTSPSTTSTISTTTAMVVCKVYHHHQVQPRASSVNINSRQ